MAAVSVEGKFIFDSANHRDFLGACLGTGIERGKVGDILVTGETGAHIMVAPDLVEHLEACLVQACFPVSMGSPKPLTARLAILCSRSEFWQTLVLRAGREVFGTIQACLLPTLPIFSG